MEHSVKIPLFSPEIEEESTREGEMLTEIELATELVGPEHTDWALRVSRVFSEMQIVRLARSDQKFTKLNKSGRAVGNRFELPVDPEANNLFAYSDCSSATKGDRIGAAAAAVIYTDSVRGAWSSYHKSWKTGMGEVYGFGSACHLASVQNLGPDKPNHLYLSVDSEYLFRAVAEGWLEKWLRTPEDADRIVAYPAWSRIAKLLDSLRKKYDKVTMYHQRSHVNEFGNTVADIMAHECRIEGGLSLEQMQFICYLFGHHVVSRYSRIYHLDKPICARKLG